MLTILSVVRSEGRRAVCNEVHHFKLSVWRASNCAAVAIRSISRANVLIGVVPIRHVEVRRLRLRSEPITSALKPQGWMIGLPWVAKSRQDVFFR